MKFYTGQTKNPGRIAFMHDGYMFQGVDDTEFQFIPYREPKETSFTIQRMYGISIGSTFFGIIRYQKVK